MYLTIKEFNLRFKYLPGHANVVVGILFRNVPDGVVTNHHPVAEKNSLNELCVAQQNHDIWSKVIYALEPSGGAILLFFSCLTKAFCATIGLIRNRRLRNSSYQSIISLQSSN